MFQYYRNVKPVSGKSRLIREDEHDKSDEDEEEGDAPSHHMTFGKKVEPARQLQVRNTYLYICMYIIRELYIDNTCSYTCNF